MEFVKEIFKEFIVEEEYMKIIMEQTTLSDCNSYKAGCLTNGY